MAIAKRHVMAALSFLGFFNIYIMRSNMGVALVAMVKSDASHIHPVHNHSASNNFSMLISGNGSTVSPFDFSEGCYDWSPTSNKSSSNTGDFDWDRKTQGAILSAFFAGYIFSQIPGGYLATRYGAVKILGIGVGASGLMTILTPFAAVINVYVLIAVRALLGVFEGVYVPATHVVWSRWAPPYERTKLVALSFSGAHIGIVFAMFGSGFIAQLINWQWIFYICGIFAILWTALWFWLAYDSPADPRSGVSPQELSHIMDIALTKVDAQDAVTADPQCGEGCDSVESSRRPTVSSTASSTVPCLDDNDAAMLKEKAAKAAASAAASRASPPWLKFATSPAVWAVACAHISHTWFFYTLMTQMAIYLNDELHLSLVKNGLLSAAPFLSFFIGQISAGYLCDWLRVNSSYSTTVIRKSFFAVGAFVASILLVSLTYVGCSVAFIAPIICLSAITAGWTVCGFYMNHIDIAPQFAGILMGITNSLATLPGIISPYIAGRLTVNSATGPPSVVASEWRGVFCIAAAVQVAGAIIFMIIGSGKEQKWANVTKNPEASDINVTAVDAANKLAQIVENEDSSQSESSIQLNDVVVDTKPVGENLSLAADEN